MQLHRKTEQKNGSQTCICKSNTQLNIPVEHANWDFCVVDCRVNLFHTSASLCRNTGLVGERENSEEAGSLTDGSKDGSGGRDGDGDGDGT